MAEPGYLGLITDDRNEQGAGVRVMRVVENGPAALAGFQEQDLITSIGERRIRSLEDIADTVSPLGVGSRLTFNIDRAGKPLSLEVTLSKRPAASEQKFQFGRLPDRNEAEATAEAPTDAAAQQPEAAAAPNARAEREPIRGQLLGIRTSSLTDDVRRRLNLKSADGALVTSRVVGSPADRAGIPLDAVIVAVDGQPVRGPNELAQFVADRGANRDLEITLEHLGEMKTVRLTLAANAGVAERAGVPARPVPNLEQVEKMEQLERRVRDLEQRLQRLEQSLQRGGK